jgi:transcriptional regulator with XRE-family HTH domain
MPTSDHETFGEILRRHRERRRLTQLSAAALVGVSRATFTQWEGNKHLPSLANVQELDRALEASGVLIDALESTRSEGSRTRPLSTPHAPATGPTVATVSRDARAALDGQLCFDDDSRPIGWRHNLVPSFERPSLVSTSFGLRAQALLGGPDAHTPALVERMLAAGVTADGTITGWKASTQHAPRLEMTAAAIESLLRAGVPLKVDRVVESIRALLDETARERPSVLSQAVEPLLRVAADADLTADVVNDLLDCRQDFQGVLLWPEKRLHRDQPLLEPSVAQTARAVTALRDAPAELVGDAVLAAEEWLAGQTNLGEDTEIIRRTLGDGTREELALHTFTPALVVQALAGAQRPNVRAITRALQPVWDRYVPSLHLWAWSNGDVPVWMLVDGVAALQAAADALLTGPPPA